MDFNKPIPLISQPPIPPLQNPQKKMNRTGIMIFLLIIVASIVTLATYFLLSVKNQKQSTPTTSDTLTREEKIPWTTYTDREHQYSFNYPETWTLTNNEADPSQFFLRYTGSEPGEIQGKFLSQEQFRQEANLDCKGSDDPRDICFTYQKTASSSAYLYPVLENNKPSYATAYVTRPNGEGLALYIAQPNTDSYKTFIIILETLHFPNERQIFPFLLCPDSWSVEQRTVTYDNFTFPVENVDESWIQEQCTNR